MKKGNPPQMMGNHKPTKFWNVVHKKENEAELTLYGEIAPENPRDWWSNEEMTGGIYVSLENFMKELEELKDCDHLTIRINSEGGDVFTAMTIRSRLEELPCTKEVIIDGLAASAASFIGLLKDAPVKMHKGSMMMIHQPSTFLVGGFNRNTIETIQSSLETVESAMLDLYEDHSTTPREELRELMAKEKWFTAEEALAHGLIEEIIGKEAVELYFSEEEQALVSAGMRFAASGFSNIPKNLTNKGRNNGMEKGRSTRNGRKTKASGRKAVRNPRSTRASGRKTTARGRGRTRASGRRGFKNFGGSKAFRNVLEVLEEMEPSLLEENPELEQAIEEAVMEAEPETITELEEAYPELVEQVEEEAIPETVEELEELAPELVEQIEEEVLEESGMDSIPETIEELEEIAPDLVEQLLEEGAEAERERLEEIDEVAASANITDKRMISRAKYGNHSERMSARELRRSWNAKESGGDYQKNRRKEYRSSGVTRTRTRPNGGNNSTTKDREKAAAAASIADYIKQK